MLHAIRPRTPLDVRELILQRVSTVAVHDQEDRLRPEEIQANYAIDQTLLNPKPQDIALVDDVLTTGAHFRAACAVVKQVFPDVPIVGLFIARRVPEAVDFEEFEL
jgi:predicted amidophosphoribosyltransferase